MTSKHRSDKQRRPWKIIKHYRKQLHLACNISQFDEEIRRSVVVPSLCLDGLDHNASHWFALLPPLHDEILNLTHTYIYILLVCVEVGNTLQKVH